MKNIVIFMLTVEGNMSEIEKLKSENMQLRDEALGWHAKAAKLEREKKELEIENTTLKTKLSILAIEVVKLKNKSQKNRSRQYANIISEEDDD